MLQVIENNLNRKSEIKSYKMEDENYKVAIFYYGDYCSDKENGTLDRKSIIASIKPKKSRLLDLDWYDDKNGGKVFIDIPPIAIMGPEEVDDCVIMLQQAKKYAEELQQIMEELF